MSGTGRQDVFFNKFLLKCHVRTATLIISIDKEQSLEHLTRITQQAEVMAGKACIRGMRVTVAMVVGQIGAGHSIDELLADFPYLEREDVLHALRYAAWRTEEREVLLSAA